MKQLADEIKKILCPIDFTDASVNAIEYAAKLAKQLNASLMLWNMCEVPIIDEIASRSGVVTGLDEKKKQLTQILKDWSEEIKEEYKIPCEYSLHTTVHNLKQALTYYTEEEEFDLIITGTNGADDIYQFFFGSNSYEVARKVKSPVLIIPEGHSFKLISKVVFATDYALEDAKLACTLSKLFKAQLRFLHLSKHQGSISKDVFNAFKGICEDKSGFNRDVKFERLVCEDKLQGLNEYIEAEASDMVILSTKYRNWLEEIFHKSFTKEVIATMQIPTLILHRQDQEVEDLPITLEDV